MLKDEILATDIPEPLQSFEEFHGRLGGLFLCVSSLRAFVS